MQGFPVQVQALADRKFSGLPTARASIFTSSWIGLHEAYSTLLTRVKQRKLFPLPTGYGGVLASLPAKLSGMVSVEGIEPSTY